MLGWAEVCMHFFDFFHVVFVACCCNPCEAFKMFIGEAVSLFPLSHIHSQVYVLTKKDITFCTSGFKVGKSSSDTKLHKWPTPALSSTLRMSFVCSSTISLSTAARCVGQSRVIVGVRDDTSMWKGFSMKSKISLCSFTSLNLDSNSPLSSSKTFTNSLWLKCSSRDGSFVVTALSLGKWINSLSGMYRAVILFWNALIAFSMLFGSLSLPWSFKLRVFRWQVMSVRKASCVIQHGSVLTSRLANKWK